MWNAKVHSRLKVFRLSKYCLKILQLHVSVRRFASLSFLHQKWELGRVMFCHRLIWPPWGFSSATTVKVRSFPAHQPSAELMNPCAEPPTPSLWSEHYLWAKQGGRGRQCCYVLGSHCTHKDHDCGSYGVMRAAQHLLKHCEISEELNQALLHYG